MNKQCEKKSTYFIEEWASYVLLKLEEKNSKS